MKKKPAILLIRGNIPKVKTVGRKSICWRCSKNLVKNDKVFEIPGPTLRDTHGHYYKANSKRYCFKCMRDNILRTERELEKLKKMTGT